MKRERADVAVGVLVLGTVLLAAAVLVWLAPALRADTYPLYTYYAELGGLAPDGPVLLRGFEVGRIGAIQPEVTPDGLLRFRVRMDVRPRLRSGEPLPIPDGTIAILRPPPVIGAVAIDLQLPDSSAGVLEPGAVLPGRSEQPLVQQAGQLGRSLAFEMGLTLEGMRALMDSLTHTASAAAALASGATAALPVMLARLDSQLIDTRRLTTELRTQVAGLNPIVAASADSLQHLLHESAALVQNVNGVVTETQPTLRSILENLESTSLVLDHLTRQIARSPLRVLTGVRVPPLDTLRVRDKR